MIDLKSFFIFENNGYPYTLEDVKALPTFKVLESMGFTEETPEIVWNHGTMRLYNYSLQMVTSAEAITIHQKGPIRKCTEGTYKANQHILKKFPPITKLEDWNFRFIYVIQWAQKRAKRYFGVEIDKIKKNPELAKLLVDEYRHLGLKFMTKYKALSNKAKKEFCDELNTNPEDFIEYMEKYKEISKKIFMEV